MRRKLTIAGCLCALVIGMGTMPHIQEKEGPKNLRVLPKDISHSDLDSTMKSFNVALGVKCGHCHAAKANGERGLDFASDENPMKNVARSMIKMTAKINKKHFKHEHEGLITNISCETCHNGKEKPFTVTVK